MIHQRFDQAVDLLCQCFQQGGKLLVCGNGGSGADAAHILGELVKGFMRKRPLDPALKARIGQPWADQLQRGLPVIDLTVNHTLIGAVANDQDGLLPYAQQVMAYARPRDVLLGISTSGNAENVIRAMITARALGAKCLALTGRDGGKMAALADVLLNADAVQTYQVQELHLPLYHALCMAVEERLFPGA